MRANIEYGRIVFTEDGEFELPVETQLLHRFVIEDGVIVDSHPGMDDDEVRAWDAANPIVSPEPEPGSGETPPPAVALTLEELAANQIAQQQQLDDITTMLLGGEL